MENTTGTDSSTIQDTVYSNAQSAANTVQNHPVTRNVSNSLSNGPVADKVKDESAKTSHEFQNLADSRKAPSQPAATGQPLTHYHSLFYSILSWENPRVTAISYVSVVLFIFGCRYLPVLRWGFKMLYCVLGATALAEVFGKLAFSQGLASSFRPKKYYTIPREALEASLEDVEQLINFFVIEFQRVLFAENVTHTVTAFTAAVLSYWLIKIVPFWGLSLISTSCVYLGPLIYMNNQEFIDHHLNNAQTVINAQAKQVQDIAGHHTSRASDTVKQYAGDYTAKAQEYMGKPRNAQPVSPSHSSKPMSQGPISTPASAPKYEDSDFPHAPKQEPTPGINVTSHQEQWEKSQFGGQAVPAS